MNTKEYLDELMLRLGRFDVISELNEPLMLSYLNKGRQQAQRFTLEYMPERYSRVSRFSIGQTPVSTYTTRDFYGTTIGLYPVDLPSDFINPFRVILKYELQGRPYSFECRYYTLSEVYNANVLSINPPKYFSPIYTVQANNDNEYKILIAGLDLSAGKSIFEDGRYTNIECEVWYTCAIGELELRNQNNDIDVEVTLPIGVEELAIEYAMYHCLRHVKHVEGMSLLMQEIQLLEQMLNQNYQQNKVVENVDIATNKE